jgi:hypothetical protein
MTWDPAISDVLRVADSQGYLFLVSATTDANFSVSAVLKANILDANPRFSVVIPPHPVGWYSMVQRCAGSDLLLTGGMYCHHEFRDGELIQHDLDIAYRGGDLWRLDSENAQYVDDGGNVVHVTSGGVEIEPVQSKKRICDIHGLHSNFRVIGGEEGSVLVNRGDAWQAIEDVPTLNSIVKVYCRSQDQIYFCAGNDTLLRWNGKADWHSFDVADSAFMYNFAEFRGETYVASLHLKTYRLEGDQAIPVEASVVAERVKADDQFLFGLGRGKFEVFNGVAWKLHELDLFKMFPKELEALRLEHESI